MRIVLHIGGPKTGSTALQRFMAGAGERMLEHGIYYPRIHFNHFFLRLFADFAELGVATGLARGKGFTSAEGLRGYLDRAWDEIGAALADYPRHTLVLSTEFAMQLPHWRISTIRDALLHYSSDITVVGYVRHPISQAISAVQQNVKVGRGTLEEIEARIRPFTYRASLEGHERVFGHEALAVREYTRHSLRGGDIRRDFLIWLGCDELAGRLHLTADENSSLSLPATYLGSEINRLEQRSGKRLVSRSCLDRVEGPTFRLSRPVLDRLRSESNDETQWLRKRFDLALSDPSVRTRPRWADLLARPLARLALSLLVGVLWLRSRAVRRRSGAAAPGNDP